ncbi:MAG: protein-export chaperone SecB [Deltaproteobacteria bacterium]|nr:protein-export chaperone SecB [Deltaproteobacteria bacterium]
MRKEQLELVQLKLQKSIFSLNHAFRQPPHGELIAVNLSLHNRGEFIEDCTKARFLQIFQIQPSQFTPFFLEVEFAALFSLSFPVSPNEHDIYINHLFPQLIFPHTRDYVAEITKRGGFPPLQIDQGVFQEKAPQNSQNFPLFHGNKCFH